MLASPPEPQFSELLKFFWLIESTLIAGVILGWIFARIIRRRPARAKVRAICVSGGLIGLGSIILFSNWSFRGIWVDAFALSTAFVAMITLIGTIFYLSRDWHVKGPILAIGILVSGLSLFLATAGVIGIGFIAGDIAITSEMSAGPGYICRQQRFGNAISENGVTVTILHTPWYLPGVEHTCFKWNYRDEKGRPAEVTYARVTCSPAGETVLCLETGDGWKRVDTLR